MNDLISRQAAIDEAEEWIKTYNSGRGGQREQDAIKHVISGIKKLSSAQPEIIRCKDCKHKHVENMVWTCPFGLPGGENFFCGYGTEPHKGE